MPPETLLLRILGLESRAARLEGAFAADPELGLMWRSGAALTEACRSVALEDIHVFEGDVIHRHLENRLTDAEGARGADAVTALLRVIASPGDLAGDTAAVLDRCWRAAVSIDDGAFPFDGAAVADRIRRPLEAAPTPFLGALRAAIVFRMETDSTAPSADRLVFIAAEHALRGAGRTQEGRGPGPASLLRRVEAGWILTPSVALTQGGFRAWSPGTLAGLESLLGGLTAEADRALGQLAVLRRWRMDAQAVAAARSGKSRLRDLVRLVAREPLLTAPYLRETLGVSRRASFTLVDEAEAAGILRCITPRTSWRVWARPDMADRLALRSPRRRVDRGERQTAPGVANDPQRAIAERAGVRSPALREDDEAREAAALAALDDAMTHADAVLAKYASRQDRGS
ncbi:hypothetical protein JSE7799_02108 [Jannaschia seosinensis]|uniref:HTH DNA binding domain protein n=1 Tax=Jannaschia seosinensis TaxID=313367 RepID=A0A0M7BBU4_9RHOB|nr:hypothetical protein [Jannaschia seosinensis]CUH39383.1 hypothetical protein JSE7799_02108 [Jannaschia seosinensis]